MKKLILLLAIVCLTSVTYAKQKSELRKKTVVARFTIKNEAVDSFVQFAQKIVEETRKETSCISYNLYKNPFGQKAEFIFY